MRLSILTVLESQGVTIWYGPRMLSSGSTVTGWFAEQRRPTGQAIDADNFVGPCEDRGDAARRAYALFVEGEDA